jgi:SAM-dependent methyltransferase
VIQRPTVVVQVAKKTEVAQNAVFDKINLGCGTNKLEGWANFDAEVNITKPLRFATSSASFILAEHVVEHVNYYQSINFFKECARVLKPGGVLRITVPSIEKIMDNGNDPEYIKFVHDRKWAPTADHRGAMHAILYCHGHQTAWTSSLLKSTLFYAGFKDIAVLAPGESSRTELSGVEGHGKVIGDKFNLIESISVEAVNDK